MSDKNWNLYVVGRDKVVLRHLSLSLHFSSILKGNFKS